MLSHCTELACSGCKEIPKTEARKWREESHTVNCSAVSVGEPVAQRSGPLNTSEISPESGHLIEVLGVAMNNLEPLLETSHHLCQRGLNMSIFLTFWREIARRSASPSSAMRCINMRRSETYMTKLSFSASS